MKTIKPSVTEGMNKFYESVVKKRKAEAMVEEDGYTG
jgi:hypothetical protein